MSFPVSALLTGKAAPFRGDEASAIAKLPVPGRIRITRLGLEGDEQADRKHHGGPHMAVHLYPHDHYAGWRKRVGEHPLLDQPGAFGENICTTGLVEPAALVGDRFRLGTALLEISQPRKPCWKIEHRFGHKGMVAHIVKTGKCGMYFRVIEEGLVEPGDRMEQVEAGHEGWSVERVFMALFGAAPSKDRSELAGIMALQRLSPDLQQRASAALG